jgi:hydrophobic/amphiphilic exporter-1 (mainly G- bacteria), HAE1 family
MIRASIGNPYAVFVGVVILLIFSWIAYSSIPIQLKPTLDPTEIRVQTTYRGAGVLEVEDQITNKLERQLASINDLDEITSNSEEGRSNITLLFNEGANLDRALLDTIQSVQRVNDLPDLADQPQVNVVTGSPGDFIMYINVAGSAPLEQKYDLLDEVVVPAILRVPGVGSVDFFGGSARQIIVQPNMQAMSARGVSIRELADALQVENQNLPGGQLEEGERQFNLRAVGRYTSLEDVLTTVIRHGPEGSITIGDVATVRDARARTTRYVRANGERSMVLRVNRQSNANTLRTIDLAQERLDEFSEQFQNQGIDLTFVTANSEKPYIEGSLHLVQEHLLLGAFLAALVLALFLRAGRPILIVVVAIPISLMSVFLVLQLLDRTVNIIVMAGLAFAAGMVVDDAIVALENIDRHMKELGKPPVQAAMEGIEEVWGAIVAATLTKIAVFLPLLLNTTEAGLLFKDIAIAVMVSIFMSLVVTITVVPALAALILREHHAGGGLTTRYPALGHVLDFLSFKWLGELVERIYTAYLRWSVLHRGGGAVTGRLVLLGAVGVIFLLSLKLLPSASYLPNGTRNFIFSQAQPIVGQRNAVTSELYGPVEAAAAADERIETYFTIAAAPFFSAVGVAVKEEYADDKTLQEITDKISETGSQIPGFRSFFARRPSIFRTRDKEFTLEITGPDLVQLKQIADRLTTQLKARKDIVAPGASVRSEFVEGVPELALRLNRYRAAELGLSIVDLAHSVEATMAGREVSTFTEGNNEYDLLIQGDPALANNRTALGDVIIDARTVGGTVQPIRLAEIATIEETVGPSSIRHFNRQRSISVTVNTKPELSTQEALNMTQEEIVDPLNAELPEGYSVFFGQAADKLRDTFTSLIFQGALAIVIIYLLMVPLFRSFYYPLIILITVPLAWSGSFLAIALAYKLSDGVIQFDVLGMLGLIIMSGIVVSNAILIIHQMLNFQHEGMEPNQALYESARTRLRPIMMTVLTAVLGMGPMAFGSGPGSELYRGLGIVVVGGLISSTIFTLLVVPALMSLINDFNANVRRRRIVNP